jgi:hypothetical protein
MRKNYGFEKLRGMQSLEVFNLSKTSFTHLQFGGGHAILILHSHFPSFKIMAFSQGHPSSFC